MGDSNHPLAWFISRFVTIAVVLLILSAFFSSYSIIEPGNTGVIFNIWTGSLRATGQGLVWRLPWITRVQSYPTALRTYTMVMRAGEGSAPGDNSIDLPTREGQHIRQDVSITYNTSEARAADVFKAFRGADIAEIESTFIRRTTITIAQNVAGQMSLTEVISDKRTDFQNAMQASLQIELDKMGFQLDKVNLGASHLPDVIEKQMQQKMAVQQQAEQAQYELQKQETLAKATVAQAQGEAQAILVKAKAQAEANRLLQVSITPNLVKYKAIEKWNGILPQVTGGNTPFIDLKGMAGAEKGE
jgi:regulator of protease activity HflC (stomatin/prohibitin superfamily)